MEAHCQYQRLSLAQRNLEPLPRLIVNVEGVSGGEEFGVVPLVAFNALSTLNRVADFKFKNIFPTGFVKLAPVARGKKTLQRGDSRNQRIAFSQHRRASDLSCNQN